MSEAPDCIALSLVAHTNVGKTTLARTLLRRDIGEVRDAPHVTVEAERQLLISTPQGDRLELWDTPGFGDSHRLARRLAQAGNPVGWFLGEVWDRFRDRGFWSTQKALRNVLDEADVVLYLVDASQAPEDAAHLDPELTVLGLLGKPVVLLLNQLAEPPSPDDAAAERERWRARSAAHACVRDVLPLDAFTRCWVQEDALLAAVGTALPAARAAVFARLRAAWRERNRAVWRDAVALLAERLSRAARDVEPVADEGWSARLAAFGKAIGLRRDAAPDARERAMLALAERLDAALGASTQQLVRLHGLDGRAAAEIGTLLAEHYQLREPLDERKAAVFGGALAGMLAGLKADLASGGLTLGGGLLAGGVLGALGAMGLARGFNVLRGREGSSVVWSDAMLNELARSALLTYLAVAHHGRGRGEWLGASTTAFWARQVDAVLQSRQDALQAAWAQRRAAEDAALRATLEAWFAPATADLLRAVCPDTPGDWLATGPA